MSRSTSINWDEVADELDRAPANFLETASKLWRSKQGKKRRSQPQKSAQDELCDSSRKDAQQQKRWKEAHDSAKEELLYFGEFTDKREHIRLLQRVKVVNRTAKQIHIVAAYTLYYSYMRQGNEPVAWSTKPDGDLFGNFYTYWRPVIRYRLRQIHKVRLYEQSALDILQDVGKHQDQDISFKAWKRLCGICLFSSEREYAEWHLARYEGAFKEPETSNVNTYNSNRYLPASYVLLGLSISASQEDIKAAYRRMAMKHHPDRGGSAIDFHKVKTAYNSLNGNRGKMNSR